jgi:endonuclease/exonuclease/phosphatase (EEP) superfamily protein YafD
VRTDDIIVLKKDKGEFFTSMKVTGKQENYTWEVINVYGPVQMERKTAFLKELTNKISSTEDPFLIGGDFNMIRFPWEKSSDITSNTWMDNFNNFIRDNGVKEMHGKGSKFTWSNKQENPVMSMLDRVLMSLSWEKFYKRSSCETLTRVGSDHCPLLVCTDDHRFKQQHIFRFEMAWLT